MGVVPAGDVDGVADTAGILPPILRCDFGIVWPELGDTVQRFEQAWGARKVLSLISFDVKGIGAIGSSRTGCSRGLEREAYQRGWYQVSTLSNLTISLPTYNHGLQRHQYPRDPRQEAYAGKRLGANPERRC